jgi:hypothetical protein
MSDIVKLNKTVKDAMQSWVTHKEHQLVNLEKKVINIDTKR